MEELTPEENEDRLYHLISDYLQRENLQALPSGQRSLMTLVLRKLLASSTFAIALFSVESLDQADDYLILSAVTDGGEPLDEETAQRLLSLPCASAPNPCPVEAGFQLYRDRHTQQRQAAIQRDISERNARLFEAEADKLDGWADDLKVGLEREIKEIDRQIKEARRAATLALTLEEKLAGQKQIRALEGQRNQKRRSLFDAQDRVDSRRDELIAQIEGKLAQLTRIAPLFVIRWILA